MHIKTILEMKAEAKRRQKINHKKLGECLNELANEQGFSDWNTLIRQTIGGGTIRKIKEAAKKHSREKWLEQRRK